MLWDEVKSKLGGLDSSFHGLPQRARIILSRNICLARLYLASTEIDMTLYESMHMRVLCIFSSTQNLRFPLEGLYEFKRLAPHPCPELGYVSFLTRGGVSLGFIRSNELVVGDYVQSLVAAIYMTIKWLARS